MPATVVSGETVDFVDDHHPQIAEQAAGIDIGRNQHHLERLGRREQAVGWVAEDLPTSSGIHVAVPQGRSPAQERAIPLEANIKVVEQGLDRTNVKYAQSASSLRRACARQLAGMPLPFFRPPWVPARSCAARRGCRGSPLLEGPQLPPSQAVHDVVLDVSFRQACMNFFGGRGIVGCRRGSLRRTADGA